MRNFQGIVFIWAQTYREIFKSTFNLSIKYVVNEDFGTPDEKSKSFKKSIATFFRVKANVPWNNFFIFVQGMELYVLGDTSTENWIDKSITGTLDEQF